MDKKGAMRLSPLVKALSSTLIIFVLTMAVSYGIWFGLQSFLHTSSPFVVVLSGSMAPTLHRGDLLIVQGVDHADEIDVGDIIVFHNPQPPPDRIVHRVKDRRVANDGWQFRTQGDANPRQDDWWLPYDHIIGRVIVLSLPIVGTTLGRIPLAGYVAMVMQGPAGPIIILILISLVFLTDLFSRREEVEGE
ncbi:MAG: signal peptidase I [Candidatus Bathyarchaeia archaeon]